jgi:hypothetical protein
MEGKYLFFCASLPIKASGRAKSPGFITAMAPARSPKASSSAASTPVTAVRSPKPPYSSGIEACKTPSSQPFSTSFCGRLFSSSASHLTASHWLRSAECIDQHLFSSVGSKEYIGHSP